MDFIKDFQIVKSGIIAGRMENEDQSPNLVGGWPTPLKNESVGIIMGLLLFPMYGKIENVNVPNHQPETFKIRDKLLLYQ